VVDVLSLVSNPFTSKIKGKAKNYIKIFAIVKVQRYFSIANLIADSDMTLTNKVLMRIVYNIVLVALYVHITACFFWYIIQSDPQTDWLPAFDYIDGSKSVMYWKDGPGGSDPQSWLYQYAVCLYYMMCVIGGNELGPTDIYELTWITLMNIFGLIFKVYLFGELSGLVV
jgi:hypothetical protein